MVEEEYFQQKNGNTQKVRQTNNYMPNHEPNSHTMKIEYGKKSHKYE